MKLLLLTLPKQFQTSTEDMLVSVVHWHSARWAWDCYQPGLGSIPRPAE